MRQALALGAALFALSAGPAFGRTVNGDFNGDGFGDLVVGAPFESVGGASDAGAVHVVYGASGGLRNSALNQTFTQSSAGIYDDPEAFDYFGYSLAVGDFNGDGYADLAIGISNEDFFFAGIPPIIPDTTYTDIGAVEVIYGSASGLDPLGSKSADFLARAAADYDNGDKFGFSLAAGNFGNGSAADLAVGSRDDDTAGSNNGTVSIFYGHTGGIDAIPSAVFAQSDADIPGDPNDQENFGAALAAGNVGKSSHADLVIGVPNDSVETTIYAGSVNVLYGSPSGIVTTGARRWTQDSPGIAGAAEQYDHFGSALAIADFGRSSRGDLAVSAPCEAIGAVSCAGGVHVIFGTKTGLAATGDQFWSQNSAGIADKPEQNDTFGLALTAANFGKSKRADLAVSSIDKIATQTWAGAVEVLYGTDGGLTATGSQFWSQATEGVNTEPVTAEYFGWALGAGNFARDSNADLAIGVPREAFGASANAGAVEVIYGTSGGLRVQNDDFLQEDDVSSSDGPGQDDWFGASLAPRPSNYGWYWFE
jgi:hypothetical protein